LLRLQKLLTYIDYSDKTLIINAPNILINSSLLIKNVNQEITITEKGEISNLIIKEILENKGIISIISAEIETDNFSENIINYIPSLKIFSRIEIEDWKNKTLGNLEEYETNTSSRESCMEEMV
jgi:hypothetical protein